LDRLLPSSIAGQAHRLPLFQAAAMGAVTLLTF